MTKTNEDVLIEVIKNLMEENKELKSSLEMYKHNYGVVDRELDKLNKKYVELLEDEDRMP